MLYYGVSGEKQYSLGGLEWKYIPGLYAFILLKFYIVPKHRCSQKEAELKLKGTFKISLDFEPFSSLYNR